MEEDTGRRGIEMIAIELPLPPSANRYWRKFGGKIVKSQEARDYQAQVGWWAKVAGLNEMITGRVSVSMWVYRAQKRGDLDNRIKVLLDSLEGIAYKNDDQVKELHAFLDDDKDNPRVVVQVEAL
jgi:crossover junction endodeoxyribonuclease RusA